MRAIRTRRCSPTIETELRFRDPMLRYALARGANTWVYQFDWPSPALRGWLGATHAIEIPFVFGNFELPCDREIRRRGARRDRVVATDDVDVGALRAARRAAGPVVAVYRRSAHAAAPESRTSRAGASTTTRRCGCGTRFWGADSALNDVDIGRSRRRRIHWPFSRSAASPNSRRIRRRSDALVVR